MADKLFIKQNSFSKFGGKSAECTNYERQATLSNNEKFPTVGVSKQKKRGKTTGGNATLFKNARLPSPTLASCRVTGAVYIRS